MNAAIILAVLFQWVLLGCTGKYLAGRWKNPDAWLLPVICGGVLGIALLAAASLPVRYRQRELQAYLEQREENPARAML